MQLDDRLITCAACRDSCVADVRSLRQQGSRQIDILADEVVSRSPGWACTIIGGVLGQACNALFASPPG